MIEVSLAAAGSGLLALPRTHRSWQVSGRFRLPGVALPALSGICSVSVAALLGGGLVFSLLAGLAGAGGIWLLRRRSAGREPAVSPLRLAASFDLLAACLRSGLGAPRAITVIAEDLPGPAAAALRRTADLLALGAPAERAWRPVVDLPATEALGHGAVRSARSGAALAEVAEELAVRARAQAHDVTKAAARRSGVLVSGPLGCCFLPAFFCLGVMPIVLGLAGRMLEQS